MSTREEIIDYVEQVHSRLGFLPTYDYSPILGFKLSNVDSKTSDSFRVSSVDEAEDLVISFISTMEKGKIFVNEKCTENSNLFLTVKVILPS